MAWCAAIVQYPARRRDAAVILRSKEEGTGKSFFADVIGKLMHRHYLSVLNPEHIIGKFNSHLANKILIFADEAFTTDDKKARAIMFAGLTSLANANPKIGDEGAPLLKNDSRVSRGVPVVRSTSSIKCCSHACRAPGSLALPSSLSSAFIRYMASSCSNLSPYPVGSANVHKSRTNSKSVPCIGSSGCLAAAVS